MIRQSIPILLCFVLLSGICLAADKQKLQFNRDIRPILSDNCFQCHGPDAKTREAGLRLDVEAAAKADRGGYAAIVPGDPKSSELISRIFETDAFTQMPPPDSGKSLTVEQKKKLQRWVAEGAAYQQHWAFEPVQRPATQGNPIDFLIRQRLEEEGLKPSPPASPTTQLRRVTLNLTGLPPTIEQTDAFLADVEERGLDKAYEAAVDRLLASPRYGEHMAWNWLEAARYADTDGYQNDGPREMWRWRDWVIDAFNSNMPFDQFTIEQLAGDLLPDPTHEQLIATGFNRNNRYNSEAGIPIDEFLLENAVDRVDTTATVWMGLTLGCARCHDHKFDPFSQKEYYQLIDYFNDVAESGRAIKFGNSEPWIKSPTDQQRERLENLKAKVKAAENQLHAAEKSLQQAQRAWEAEASFDQPVLNDGLTSRFDFDAHPQAISGVFGKAVAADEKKHVTLKPVHGLVGNGRFSVSFWMKPDQVDSGPVLSNEAKNTQRAGILVEFVEGRLRWHIIHRWISGVQTIETKRPFQPGEWSHIVLTNDGTQRTRGMQIYVDGQRQEVTEIYNTNSNASNGKRNEPIKIGYSKHVGRWQGSVDELRFYTDRTLSDEEAALLAVPRTPEEIVNTPAEERSDVEQRLLRLAFLEQGAATPQRQLLTSVRKAKADYIKYYDNLPTTMIMRDLPEGRPSFVRERGVYDAFGEPVQPGVPEILPPLPEDAKNNRLAFARWLVSPEHPLTARVTVNRFWQSLFGRGIVKTPGDFGSQGDPPTHPQLLDWLAAEFVQSGWDVKHLLKQIVMSKTYRQSSKVTAEHLEQDPENILLARAPRLRLSGNILRDQALAVSGLLVEKVGGPSVKPYQPKGLWAEASNFRYKQGRGEDLYRRSLYTYWKRTLAPPTMAVLDTGDREYCTVRPKRTNTPLQALTLLNETTFVEAARELGERMLIEGGKTDAERVEFGFRVVATRRPSSQELEVLVAALQEYRQEFQQQPELAKSSLQVGESKPNSDLKPVELAASMALANVLLNLEEVTTRE